MYYLKVTDKVEFADSKLCRIRINPSFKGNKGLLAHEEMHVKQWYAFMLPLLVVAAFLWFNYRQDVGLCVALLAIFAKDLLYTAVPRIRYELEVMAYREQVKHAADKAKAAEHFADIIIEHYDVPDSRQKLVNKLAK